MYALSRLLDQLYAAVDMPEAVPELNPTDSGDYWSLDCPCCGQHEAYASKKNIGYIVCRGSAEFGRAFTLYRYFVDVKRLSTGEALKTLSDLAQYPLDLKPEDMALYEKEQRKMALLEEVENFFVSELWSDSGAAVRKNLLETRKYSEKEIRGMRLGFFSSRERLAGNLEKYGCTEEDEKSLRFDLRGLGESHTLTIPYRDSVGNLKGFCVMSIDSSLRGHHRYLWTARRDTFFNLQEAREKGIVTVVKNPLDALIISQRGIKEIIATGGGPFSESLLDDAIKNSITGFILGHDLDTPNREDTLKAIDLVRADQKGIVFVMELPNEYRELEEYLKERPIAEFESLVQEACKKNYGVQWKTNRILDIYSEEKYGEQGAYRALDEIKAFRSRLTDPLDRDLVLDIVSEWTNADRISLEESLDSYREIRAGEDLRRALKELSRDILRRPNKDPERVLYSVSQRIKDLAVKHEMAVARPAQPLQDFFKRQFDLELERSPDGLLGYQLGKFSEIAQKLDGIQPGLYVIKGYPGVGKTAFLVNLFLDLLLSNPGTSGTYFSFDDNREVIRSLLISIWTEIPRNKVRKGHDTPMTYAKKKKANNEIVSLVASRRLVIKDLSEVSDMNDLELEVRQACVDDSFVFIDGLSHLQAGGSAFEQAEGVKRMKQWVDTYRIPVFCAANLRGSSGSEKETPLVDGFERDHYGHAASAVFVLSENRQPSKEDTPDEAIPLTLRIEKNKLSGFKGVILLTFIPSTGFITESKNG